MKTFSTNPDWVLKMFNNLCFSQVKEQLPENISFYTPNPPSFINNGHLYVLEYNCNFIIGELSFSNN